MFAKKPKLDSIEFDREHWQVFEESRKHRTYGTSAGDVIRFAFNPYAPKWLFDLTDLIGAQEYYEKQSSSLNGVMLSLEIEQYANVDVLSGVFKYRSPEPDSLGMYFVGMSVIPFRNFNYQINVECVEKGTTGTREAVVLAALMSRGELPEVVDEEPEMVDSVDGFHSKLRDSKIRVSPSDDPKYDSDFPDHPLTIVRDTQFEILSSLRVPDWIANKPKFR